MQSMQVCPAQLKSIIEIFFSTFIDYLSDFQGKIEKIIYFQKNP